MPLSESPEFHGDEDNLFSEDNVPGTSNEELPPHLRHPQGSDYMTIIDVSGVHCRKIHYCLCPNSKPFHLQLLYMNLFSCTLESPRTAFTFAVLDDFIRDNLECGTSAHNYYNKLCRITSNAWPHLVVNRYRELLRISHQWRLLKLMKWNGFGHMQTSPKEGDLVLFCPACPQPGVNVFSTAEDDLSHWKYTRGFIMDGNFKAEHLKDRKADDQV
ncbi:hypothetical protein JVU11DRAFT_11133 [Chiua virens]|nr:hypothetical protein JVU11DRAFT_11133 [Chiua virens]